MSGLVASVGGKIISRKYVVAAKVRHSQRMNDPLVNVWMITESEGAIISAQCSGCEAGLAESCSHVGSAISDIHRMLGTNQWKAGMHTSENVHCSCQLL